jgi:hypothetical protein
MMLGTYGAEANPKNRERAAQTRNDRIASKREDLARRLEALKGGN